MLGWIDPVEVGGIAYITNAVVGGLKRAFRWKGQRVILVALFVACALAVFRAFDRDPTITGWPLARALFIGVITGFAAVAFKTAAKPREGNEGKEND